MMSPTFYNKKRLASIYLEGKVLHFPIKDASFTLEWYNYIIKAHETIYSISARIFGEHLEHMWTYIADNNPPRHPDDWVPGDTIRLPKIIIRDSDSNPTR